MKYEEKALMNVEESAGADKVAQTLVLNSNQYIRAATAPNTRMAYRSDVRHFERWGGLLPANSQQVIAYLVHYAGKLCPDTLARRLTALKQWHVYHGFNDPTQHPHIKKMVVGMSRVHSKPANKAHPLSIDELTLLVQGLRKQSTLAAKPR